MKLSTKGRYGPRAVIDLALTSENEAVSISSIAARQSLSESYLEQLMGKLRKAGIVKSIRGAQGGYRLGRPPEEISVGDILRALEEIWTRWTAWPSSIRRADASARTPASPAMSGRRFPTASMRR